jgi:hypothetical protein
MDDPGNAHGWQLVHCMIWNKAFGKVYKPQLIIILDNKLASGQSLLFDLSYNLLFCATRLQLSNRR